MICMIACTCCKVVYLFWSENIANCDDSLVAFSSRYCLQTSWWFTSPESKIASICKYARNPSDCWLNFCQLHDCVVNDCIVCNTIVSAPRCCCYRLHKVVHSIFAVVVAHEEQQLGQDHDINHFIYFIEDGVKLNIWSYRRRISCTRDSAAAIIPLTVALGDCNDLFNCSRRENIRTATLKPNAVVPCWNWFRRPRAFVAVSSVTSDEHDSRLASTTAYWSRREDILQKLWTAIL